MLTYFGNCNSPWESLILFEAVKEGLLPTVVNRLSEDERKNIGSGAIFVWDERRSSIRRWTDGITWSNSRVIGDFLEYRELLPDTTGDERPCRLTVKAYGLCKRTLCLSSGDDPEEPKLRLVSYYSKRDAASGLLPLPSADPRFKGIVQRLENTFGVRVSARQNEFHRLSGVFRRNPSPTRDRRKARQSQSTPPKSVFNPYASHSEPHQQQITEFKTEFKTEVPATTPLSSPTEPPAQLEFQRTSPKPSHDEPHTYKESLVRPSNQPTPRQQDLSARFDILQQALAESARGRGLSLADMQATFQHQPTNSERDHVLVYSLRSGLTDVREGDRTPVPILPQPLARNRPERKNSEDLRLLGKLDNCVNAFY